MSGMFSADRKVQGRAGSLFARQEKGQNPPHVAADSDDKKHGKVLIFSVIEWDSLKMNKTVFKEMFEL